MLSLRRRAHFTPELRSRLGAVLISISSATRAARFHPLHAKFVKEGCCVLPPAAVQQLASQPAPQRIDYRTKQNSIATVAQTAPEATKCLQNKGKELPQQRNNQTAPPQMLSKPTQ